MNELRKQFEVMPEIAETIKNGIYYDGRSNRYWSAVGASYVSLARINGAWYAFQEQQKKIDAIVSIVREADLSNGNSSVAIVHDEIQELLK